MNMFSISYTKKLIVAVCIFAIAITLASCSPPPDPVVSSLGEYIDYVYYSSDGFQDYTTYAKYHYPSASFEGNAYFKKIEQSDFSEIKRHLDDFEEWVTTDIQTDSSSELVNYDFDFASIDTEDYFYIESEEGEMYNSGTIFTFFYKYNVYFFDTQTKTLYYFHNNI